MLIKQIYIRPLAMLAVVVGLVLFGQRVARAQDYSLQIGAPTFTTVEPVELGFINLANGNLHQQVSLGSFMQRGSHPYAAALVYDGRIWKQVFNGTTWTWQPTNVANSQAGWRFLSTGMTGSASWSSKTISRGRPPMPCYIQNYNFNWTAADGTQRFFSVATLKPLSDTCGLDQPTSSGFANDSSGFYMSVTNYNTVTVYAPDGSQVYPKLEDTNGNYFSKDVNGNIIDTLGRTPITVTSNCNGNSNQTCYAVLNAQGSRSTYTVTTTSISVNTAFHVSGVTDFSGQLTAIQKITLPDGTFYQFGYDPYGALNSVTLPTLGQISYGYSNYQDSFGGVNHWVASRVSGGGNWSYTPAVITTCASGQVGCQQKVTVTKPSTDQTVYTFTLNNGAWSSQIQIYTGSTTLLSTLVRSWNLSNACTPAPCTGNNNIQTVTETLTLPVPSGSISKATQYLYDSINDMNVKAVQEWSFYSGSQPTMPNRETDFTPSSNRPVSVTTCIPVGTPPTCTGSTNILAQTNYSYDDPNTLFNTSPATGIQNHDDAAYGISNTSRGNLTSIKRCTNLSACSANYVQTVKTYDTTGQVLSVQDPNLNTTSFSYTDAFYKDVGDGPGNPPQTYSPPAPTNAYITTATPPLIPASRFGYYWGTGQLALATDPNGNATYTHFFDSFSRPTSVVQPNGGWSYTVYSAAETQLDTYTGITGPFATSGCTGCRQDEVLLDSLRRVTSRRLMSDPEGIDYIVPSYDTSGRVLNSSHPYRATSDATYGLETPTYDGLNRIIKVTHQDTTYSQTSFGAAISGTGVNTTQLCSSSTYGLGYPTLFIDEAGKKRETWRDGFGRIIEGDEPDSSGSLTSNTCYSYDLLGNLLQIVHGSQTRTYVYDALSRTTSVTIPELANSSGTNCAITYSYDSNSNVQTRTEPTPNVTPASCASTVTTTYSYDALNRLTKISYGTTTPVSTPTVQYVYDGATPPTGCTPPSLADSNPRGRITAICDGSGATSWAHNPLGQILSEKRTILGVTQTLSYTYNLDGSRATVTYPSGKSVTYTLSNAQRFTAAKDVANSIQFVTGATYAAPGELLTLVAGQVSGGFAGMTESHSYNNRLQYTGTQATSTAGTAQNLSLCYNQFSFANGCSASAANNDGMLTGVANSADSGRSLTFSYDPLSRISTATTQGTSGVDCWGQNFAPDALANLNNISSSQCSSGTLSVSLDANNHITNSGFGYDAAGNMTQDGKPAGYSYSFDGEDRLTLASGMTGGPYCYLYDGKGLRVAKKSGANSDCSGGSVTRLYWRLPTGDSFAETDGSGSTTNASYIEYVFFAGHRVASRNGAGAIFYYFADNLGSIRTVTTGSGPGQTPGQLCYDAEFTPYGQEISHAERLQTTACPPSYKFTGYERDAETAYGQGDTGLDYAFARHYSSRLGRFLSTDPLGGSIGNLQSHNAYAYVINNPLNVTDSNGLSACRKAVPGVCPQGFSGAGFGSCSLDGVDVPCSFALDLLSGSESAVQCPDSTCFGVGRDANGNPVYAQFYAFAGGVMGYYNPLDLANGINEANGNILDDANYAKYIIDAYSGSIELQRQALARAIAANSNGTVSYEEALDSLHTDGGRLQGGNYDFQVDYYDPGDLNCDGNARCNGVHFSDGFVHLDTTNPFAGDAYSFVAHSFVDVFLGNWFFTVIPR